MTTHLERLFSSLSIHAALETLVNEQREEGLHLEFKQKTDRRNGALEDGDKKAFSKALSGFANADGGVLVFGIETQKARDGVDRAHSLKPISGHHQFRARLLDSILNTTQPVIDDIRIEFVDSPEDPNAGYVSCLIPQSVKPQHRAMLADQHYWRRTSSGHRRMDHYELEDVFGRRLRSSLKLRIELRVRQDPDPHEELHYAFLNEGRGLARHVGFLCRLHDVNVARVYGHGLQNATHINGGAPTITFYDAHGVVHANGIYSSAGYAVIQRESKGQPLALAVTWYAESADTRRMETTLLPGASTHLP